MIHIVNKTGLLYLFWPSAQQQCSQISFLVPVINQNYIIDLVLMPLYLTLLNFALLFQELLAFIMIPILQKQLDTFKATLWNAHRIRTQKDTLLPDGVPDHIYSFPEEYGLQECGKSSVEFIFNMR